MRWKAMQRNFASRRRRRALRFVVLLQSVPAGLLWGGFAPHDSRPFLGPNFLDRTQFWLILAILTRWNGSER